MSVTFSIEFETTGRYTFDCYTDGVDGKTTHGPFSSYDDALLAVTAHKMKCVDCDLYGCYANAEADVTEEFDVNMSNENATRVMEVLGLDTEDLCGSMDAREFMHLAYAAASVQDAVGDNSVVPTVERREPGCPTMVMVGVPEGYVLDRLTQLGSLARLAVADYPGRKITWG